MEPYHKIQSMFKRNPATKYKTLILGEWSLPEFEYLKKNMWTFTEKVDGTNTRVMFDGQQITFGGRSDNADIPTVLLKNLMEQFLPKLNNFKSKFIDKGEAQVCFYGEGYGGKIQKGGSRYGIQQRFVLFDVKIGEWWLQRKDVEDIAIKMDIDIVPIVGAGTLLDMVDIVNKGTLKSQWGDFIAEGLVARPTTELMTRSGHRMITKLKCKDFQEV